jgi:glucose/arabinose dehydrogenase/mono/diheme cytochrome c family protein
MIRLHPIILFAVTALLAGAQSESTPAPSPYSDDHSVIAHGRQLAEGLCASCHALDHPVAGPTLGGITAVRNASWLLKFIQDPQGMIEQGDAHAVKLFDQYKIAMPGFGFLPESDLMAILSFIRAKSAEQGYVYNPTNDRGALMELMVLPQEPIPKLGLRFALEDFAILPLIPEKRGIVRIATLRYRPDQPEELFVSNQDGFIYRLHHGVVEEVLDIRQHFPDFIDDPGLATGLGSFVFHPDFATNRLIYVSHTEAYRQQPADYEFDRSIIVPIQWILSEVKLPSLDASFDDGEWRELLRINVPRHVHGMQDLVFSPLAKSGDTDYGLLYIGLGDGGATRNGNPELCHNLQSPLGTIMRINPTGSNGREGRYGIPPDNPFITAGDPNTWSEIYAWGFRNPHRLTWDHLNGGRLLANDVGERIFEEINIVKPGRDYGWNIRDAHVGYDAANNKEGSLPVDPDVIEPEFELPLAVYSHMEGNAISGGYVYRGSVSALQGKYIFGDIVTGRIFCLDVTKATPGYQKVYELEIEDGQGSTTSLRQLTARGRVDLRFGEDADGELYIMTKPDGKVRRVIAAPSR